LRTSAGLRAGCNRIKLGKIYNRRCSCDGSETIALLGYLELSGAFKPAMPAGMIDQAMQCTMSHARFALGEAGLTGGVITKSNKQTDNVSLCSLCPQCNAIRGYPVPTGDWYLAIRARRARTRRVDHARHAQLGYRVTVTIHSKEQSYRVTTTK
jgi:hypothetical protein